MACILLAVGIQRRNVKSKIDKKYFKIMVLLATLIYTAGLTLPAYSSTPSEAINVSVDINASCILSTTNLNFGRYDAIGINASEDLLATATISTTCSPGTNGSVYMDYGKHSTPKFRKGKRANRNMASGEYKLNYEIYTDKELSSIWDFLHIKAVIASGSSEDLTVYAKVFANQLKAAAGSYTDTINITLNY